MTRISTKLTKLLDIRTPLVSGVMAGASGGSLAAQVTLGGGFGFLSAGYGSIEKFKSEVALARSLLRVPPSSPLPIGVGYLAWQLEKSDSSALHFLEVAVENNVKAVWLSFGERIEQWIRYVRDKESTPGTVKIFVQVSTTEEVLVAINKWKADVIVVQGIEAGGHGLSTGSSLLTLLSEALAIAPKDAPPILAAGGMTNGAHLASLLTLGASGIVLGTRFLMSPESLYTDVQRQALIFAKTNSAMRTMAFDHARNTLGWPRGIDGRGLRNSTVDDFEKGIDIDTLRRRFEDGKRREDPDRILVWSGTGIGLLNKSQPAKEIVEEVHQECVDTLRTAALLVE